MTVLATMRDALSDPHLLGHVIPGDSWAAWRALLIAAMGEPLTDDEREHFVRLTGRDIEPLERVEELWCVVGRRGGKTRAAAVIAVYFSALVDHTCKLAIGERGIIPFMASSTKQATKAFGYAAGIFESTPMLSSLITNRTADTLSLSTRIDLEVRPASWRTGRGDTCVAMVADEMAFWRSDESANPDTEILNALRPSLATTNGPMVVISSPHGRKGELFTTWKRHYGPDGDPLILVAQAASRDLNPSLPQRVVDRAMERDPAAASAEWLGQFRVDVEALLTLEAVERCVDEGVLERAPVDGVRYVAFVDPSGGSTDSFCLAIGHREKDEAVVDAIRERKPPFSPEGVVDEFATLLRTYRISEVRGDRYAGQWPREQFEKRHVTYRTAEKTKSDIYRDIVPIMNSGRAALIDSPRLVTQLVGLERRTARGGRDSIDHAPGAHDDTANAVAGLIDLLMTQPCYDHSITAGSAMQIITVDDYDAYSAPHLGGF